MPIVTLQMRARELGRIRMGQVTTSSEGVVRPTKLDRFRITSASQALIEKVAALYGGQVRPWKPQGGGADQWEVITEATRLPVLVPPQPVSQWFELWSGGGCQRRCDGVREIQTDSPCLCDPEDRGCKPTTRLNVVLSEVEGIGVFRLESHGYYAATELPSAAELLAASNGYISGHLALEERVVKRAGETRRFMVPTLDVGVTPTQLMAGNGAQGISASVSGELSGPAPRSIEAAPQNMVVDQESVRLALTLISREGSLDQLRALWPDAKAAGLETLAIQCAADIKARPAPVVIEADDGDADALWLQIMQAVPEDWSTSRVEADFARAVEVSADKAGAGQMSKYLRLLKTRAS